MCVKQYLSQNESLIRNALLYYDSEETFSVSGLTRERNHLFEKIRTSKRIKTKLAKHLHEDYSSINQRVASIADPLEKFRAKIAALNIVQYAHKSFNHPKSKVIWNTVFMPQHEVDFGLLKTITPWRVKNKVERAIGKLIDNGYQNALAVGFVEVQVTELNGYQYFSPHIHFVTWGIPKSIIKKSIKVRRLKNVRSRMKLEVSKELPSYEDTISVIKYSCDFEAELNETYISNDSGEIGRADQRMPDKPYGEWLEWMCQYSASDLLLLKGFDRYIGYKFRNATLQEIVEEFLTNNKTHPQLYL